MSGGRGWHGDSRKHSLAAHGIKTKDSNIRKHPSSQPPELKEFLYWTNVIEVASLIPALVSCTPISAMSKVLNTVYNGKFTDEIINTAYDFFKMVLS